MEDNALTQVQGTAAVISDFVEIANLQRATEEDLRQCVGQLAQLIMALKSEMDEMHRDIMGKVTITSSQAWTLQEAVRMRVRQICESKTLPYEQCGRTLRESVWRELRADFSVYSHRDLPACQFQSAMDFVSHWNSLAALRRARGKYGL